MTRAFYVDALAKVERVSAVLAQSDRADRPQYGNVPFMLERGERGASRDFL